MKKIISTILVIVTVMAFTMMVSAAPVIAGEATGYIKGDVNGDGKVNNKDVVAIFRYLSSRSDIDVIYATDDFLRAMDVNEDGEVNNKDVVVLFRAVSQLPDKCEHKYESEVTIDATCEHEGEIVYTCIYCDHSYTKVIPKMEHEWSEWENVEFGIGERTCEICGKTERCEHEYIRSEIIKEATCKEEGECRYTCTKCGDSYTRSIDMKPHEWSDWKVMREPTTTQTGYQERTCKNCGETEKTDIDRIYEYRIVTQKISNGMVYAVFEGDVNLRYGVFDRRTWGEPPTIVRTGYDEITVTWTGKDGQEITETMYGYKQQENCINVVMHLWDDGTYDWEYVMPGGAG